MKLASLKIIGQGGFVVALSVLFLAPLYLPGYWLGTLTIGFFLAIYAMAWDLLFGHAEEVNFGPTFLVGLGAYAAAICNTYWNLPIPVCILAGMFAALVGGLILAGPALRLEGPYFGLVTLVAVMLLLNAITIFSSVTGGEIGLAVPSIFTIDAALNFYIALVAMLVSGLLLWLLMRSPVGLAIQSAGQDRMLAATMGISVVRYKLIAFSVSSLLSGAAGAMTVFYFGTVSPGTVVAVAVTIQIIIAALVGGRRSFVGSAVGAIFLLMLTELLRPMGQGVNIAVPAIGLFVLLVLPGGLISLFRERASE